MSERDAAKDAFGRVCQMKQFVLRELRRGVAEIEREMGGPIDRFEAQIPEVIPPDLAEFLRERLQSVIEQYAELEDAVEPVLDAARRQAAAFKACRERSERVLAEVNRRAV